MATKTNNPTPAPSYVDFEPYCEYKKEDATDTLILNLPDFKKEELRVQVNKDGILKVSGERPTNADGSRRARFVKETKILEGCDIGEIKAKFTTGHLHIIMPKKVKPPTVDQQPTSTPTEPPRQEVIPDQKPKTEHKMGPKGSTYDQAKGDHLFEHESFLQKLQGKKKVILGFGIAAVTMVAIGAFVASKYGSNSITSSSLYMED